MNRFLFRAWDEPNQEMLDWNTGAWLYEEDNGFHCGYNATDGTPGIGSGDWVNCPVMQFTGLHDRDGTPIFEGDLLEEGPGYLFEVSWDTEWAKFKLQWRTKAIQYPEWNRGKKMVIVGNIYQHHELLNQAA